MATGYLPKHDIDETTKRVNLYVAGQLFRLPAILAPLVAKKAPTVAGRIIDEKVRQALTEIAETDTAGRGVEISTPSNREATGEFPQLSKTTGRREKPAILADLSPVALAIMRTDLLARRLELRRAIARGELINIKSWEREELARIMIVKNLCLALPHKLAPFCERASAAKVVDLVEDELTRIIHHLACSSVSHKELINNKGDKNARA